jgi:uncharacterized delta-60 repeat protein
MMTTRAVRVVLVAVVGVVAWCVGVGGAVGAPGDLDTSFSTDGIVMTDIGGNTDDAWGVAVDSVGRVVVAGYSHNGSNEDFAVVRYTSAGVLDAAFSSDGIRTTDFVSSSDYGRTVAVDAQDRVIVAGHYYNGSDNDFGVVRYTTDGMLDTSFSTDGIRSTAIGSGHDEAYGVAIDSQGRIVVAGRSYNGTDFDLAVVRYTTEGFLDTSFNADGKLTTAIGSGHDEAYGVAVDAQDRVIVAGHYYNGSNNDFAVVRYTTEGFLDTSFSTDGMVTTAIGSSNDNGQAVALDSQGRVIVAGYYYNGTYDDFAVVRYTTDGMLDTSFSVDGKVTTTIDSSSDLGRAVAVDLDDRIVVAGFSNNGSNTDFAVVRYTSAGVLDTSFSTDGIATTDFDSSDEFAYGVVVDSAGRVVVAGYSYNGSNNDFAVVRYVGASAPGAPSGVMGVAGDGVVALGWVAPPAIGSAYEVVTDYVVEYSSDGGVTWFVFADGVSTSTSATVTGLSNGTGYVFRVSAVNGAGTGPVSVVSAEVAPWWPAPAGCTITGTPGDDVLYGTSGDDHICGLGGNDKIYGKAGADVLDGGPGNDVLKGGKGKDKLYGRGGADVLKGGPGNDKLYGNGGRDKLYGEGGNDRLVGGSSRDKLYGQGGRDKLYGGKGKDVLAGGPKKDVLNGGKGKDKAKKPGPDVLVSIEVVVP